VSFPKQNNGILIPEILFSKQNNCFLFWERHLRVGSTIVVLGTKFFRQPRYDVLTELYDEDRKWFDRGKVRTRILVGPFSLYEVNYVSLVSMFGSLPTTNRSELYKR
jgi:hypothetical protein